MTTNADVELELARRVPDILRQLRILPDGYACEIRLHRGNRKKRRDAEFVGNWDPDADSIRITLSPAEQGAKAPATSPTEDRLCNLLQALHRAELRPGYEFVSLKWFRDAALVQEAFAWANNELARHDALREAIDRRLILTSKIANPRPPNFPVTAIRLNRQMPEVAAAIGARAGGIADFHPIAIRGEALSATVLRDRR